MPRVALAVLASAVVLPALAQPAPPRPGPPSPPPGAAVQRAPDPLFDAARQSFEALPEADRRAVQDALVWTGDFNAVDSGAFGRRTFEALLAFQRRAGLGADGTLDDRERAALLAEGRRLKVAAGFAVRTDRATGVSLGVPGRLLPREEATAQGTRWGSADGRITLETRAFKPGETDLDATFDRVSAAGPDRKVTYRLKRPDFLVVSGETPTGRFFIRYATTPLGLRGFTLGYDKALAGEVDRIVIAVANSFDPAPGASVPSAGLPLAAGSPPRPGSDAASASAISPGAPTMTALDVAPGRLLASAVPFARCPDARVAGAVLTVVARAERLVLLAVPRTRGAALPPLAASASAPEAVVVVATAADGRGISVSPGDVPSPERLSAPLQPGAAGAPVVDRAGALLGLVADYPSAPRLVAGVAPPATYDVVPAAEIARFLDAQGLARPRATAPGGRLTAGEIGTALAPSVVTLACGR